ncbi:MAG: hypothetical protein QM802_09655 [Agriterribacter sp.]
MQSIEKSISKETESDFTKLGLYQVAGGIMGIVLVLWAIYKSSSFSGIIIIIYLSFTLCFGYSIFCGMLCLNTNKNALKLSLINQCTQAIGFAIMGYAFKYIAGFYFTIGLDLSTTVETTFGIGVSKIDFNFNTNANRLEIDFNLVALGLIYWIVRLQKRVRNETTVRALSSIGYN